MHPKTDVSANAGELEMFQIATEKRSIVWTCATAKYNLRLLMMRSDQPTRETGTSLSESSSSSWNVPHPLNRQVIRLVGQRQEVAWWQDEEMCQFSRESEHVVTSPTNRLILCPLDISPDPFWPYNKWEKPSSYIGGGDQSDLIYLDKGRDW